MSKAPKPVVEFLSHKRIAVAGVSRDVQQPANAIYRKLKGAGYQVYAVNPNAAQVEGDPCYPDLHSTPELVEAVMIVTHPDISAGIVRECADLGIRHVWLHRSFGQGSVSDEAVAECERLGVNCLVGGCPMMYCEPVDFGHRCMKWVLRMQSRLPN
ncbi:MAG TPA: CoA-binding protein [Blastocatellia bacterium]|nr:CoA-binding protein [Blastocatellia bacterium]